MHPCVFLIFSLLLFCLETTTANQLAAVGGGDDKCFEKEKNALLHFKSLLQDPSDHLSMWTSEQDNCCQWSGVTCNNQTGHVTELDLMSFGLVGEISHALVNLTYLNYLDLSENSFHGTIPRSIGSLTQLRYLRLSYNSLYGTIPRSIGSLTELKYLDLMSCGLVGEISHSLVNLTYLNHLNLYSNSFHGTIPTFIGSLTRLRYLDLGGNNLNGTIPRSIGSLTELIELDLSFNSLYGTIPPEFGNLTNLQYLYLSYVGMCRLENLEWLSPLSHLEVLEMDGISLAKTNHWVDVILSLPKLSRLSLSGCELSQVMYPYSSSFLNSSSSSSIEFLYLGNNSLTSSMYRWLFPLTSNKLCRLDLSGNMLDGIPKYLGNLCSLKYLYFFNTSAAVKFPDFLNNLSGCTSLSLQRLSASGSQFTGSLPDDIQKFTSLTHLSLSENQLKGTISKKLWELPNLKYLDLSENSLHGFPSSDYMSNRSHIESIRLSSCKLGPLFPKWIQNLKNLTSIDIANSSISDTIPLEFWDTWPSQLTFLNLSFNKISGKVPDLSSNFDNKSVIDLSSNRFDGPITNVSSTVALLNLSRNKFSGGISFLCKVFHGFLVILDLSHNFLSGQLPDCLWHFKELQVLNLEHNNLSGRLPASLGSMIKLEALDLYKNDFSEEFPLSVKNCTSLKSLNLGANKFSGNLPVWIGESLSGLYVLMLRSNNFSGSIPLQLCQLASLQILDLSVNHFHGRIPSCLSNLTIMVQQGFSQLQNLDPDDILIRYSYNVDHVMIQWQGTEREFIRSNMKLLRSIDLSSNNLTGEIPYQITNLDELIALNLSKNALLGKIPWKMGQMKNLLILDLSRNKFSGEIPSSMSQMTLLSYLDVSCNNLSGRIPSSTQLQTFGPSRYEGNLGLCGPSLTEQCHGNEESGIQLINGESEGDGEGVDELDVWFYIGGAIGFIVGFWIACGALLLNRRGRYAFFYVS
ncbi:receptor-like protein EIX1 [Lactuca sativa]|uniref:receptor-like protein EIX1 n=1 Tax=Lactuca sativa TaxID=4236 RepID=UPI000CD97E4C|nr:receptor-like protein EIX1 [Lactuca sativa]